MQLRHNDILVVARITNQRARRRCTITREVDGMRIASAADRSAEQEALAIVLVEIRLIAGTSTVDAIQVEGRCAEIDQRVRIALLLEAALRTKRQVVVDELAEIGIQSRDPALFLVRAVVR